MSPAPTMGSRKRLSNRRLSAASVLVSVSIFLLQILDSSSSHPAPSSNVDDDITAASLRRGGSNATHAPTTEGPEFRHDRRIHPIRRIYGEDNASVRAEVRRIETGENGGGASEYWRTGMRGDSAHRVEYSDHPHEQARERERRAEESERGSRDGIGLEDDGAVDGEHRGSDDIGDGGNGDAGAMYEDVTEEASASPFQPLRIHFDTSALEELRKSSDLDGDRVDFIVEEILPLTAEFWSRALSVIPVAGRLRLSKSELFGETYCGDPDLAAVPSDHVELGVPGADLVLYASGSRSSKFCAPRTMAVAVACNADQWDRPTAGAVNFCMDRIGAGDLSDGGGDGAAAKRRKDLIQDFVDVAVHEAAHVLGMSSNSYKYFRDPGTGLARTERPIQTKAVTCVDGTSRLEAVPNENTLRFFEDGAGRRRAEIVTERVAQVARNQFDCQSLVGAPLENQPTSSSSCTGDHWDERLFYPEALSGIISPTTDVLSPLTLALFEDSGWYLANYSASRVSPWGHGAGCDFVRGPCLTKEVDATTGRSKAVVPDYGRGYFCAGSGILGCSPAHTHRMACTVIDYDPSLEIDPHWQYFPGEPHLGGPRQADFCPVYSASHSGLPPRELDCRDSSNLDAFVNLYSEEYGPGSMCVETSAGGGRCHAARCVVSDLALKIRVRGTWHTCHHDFEQIDVRVAGGAMGTTVTCPRLSAACPDMFCPANCAGRGVCVFPRPGEEGGRARCAYFDPADAMIAGYAVDDAMGAGEKYFRDDAEEDEDQEGVGFLGRFKKKLTSWAGDGTEGEVVVDEEDGGGGFFGRLKNKVVGWKDKGIEEVQEWKSRFSFSGLLRGSYEEDDASNATIAGEEQEEDINGEREVLPSHRPAAALSLSPSTASSAIPSVLPSALPSSPLHPLVHPSRPPSTAIVPFVETPDGSRLNQSLPVTEGSDETNVTPNRMPSTSVSPSYWPSAVRSAATSTPHSTLSFSVLPSTGRSAAPSILPGQDATESLRPAGAPSQLPSTEDSHEPSDEASQ